MPIPFSCTQCGKQAKVPEKFANKKVKCKCGNIVLVRPPQLPASQPEDDLLNMDLDSMQYQAVAKPAQPRTQPSAKKKKLSRREREDRALAGALGEDWKDGPKSEYRQVHDEDDENWMADAWNVISSGPVPAFWGYVIGILMLGVGIHLFTWTAGLRGRLGRRLRAIPIFCVIFGVFVAGAGLIAMIGVLVNKEKREKHNPQTIIGIIAGTCFTTLLLLGFSIWMFFGIARGIGGGFDDDNFADVDLDKPYLALLAARDTKLFDKGPAPQEWEPFGQLVPGQKAINYPSGKNELKALQWMPPGAGDEKLPAVIYLHGGFALGDSDLMDCQPFIDAGFFVMCPSYRGENGNPGNFELMHGEVDDAIAAIDWVKSQSFVDPDRIYVFGHSIGGGISTLISLHDVDVQMSGSSGGLYTDAIFYEWPEVPFDSDDYWEVDIRLLLGHISQMKHHHIAYLGRNDRAFEDSIEEASWELDEGKQKLGIMRVPGDHFSSLQPAIKKFIEAIQQ